MHPTVFSYIVMAGKRPTHCGDVRVLHVQNMILEFANYSLFGLSNVFYIAPIEITAADMYHLSLFYDFVIIYILDVSSLAILLEHFQVFGLFHTLDLESSRILAIISISLKEAFLY